MRLRTTLVRTALAVAVSLAAVADADAQVLGIRVTPTGGTGYTVNVAVTDLLVPSYPFSTAFIGVATAFGYQVLPAIDWGDGATVPAFGYGTGTGIPLTATTTFAGTPVRSYRGAFSHTYAPVPGAHTVRVNSFPYASTTPPLTGNLQPLPAPYSATNIVANSIVVAVPLAPVPTLTSVGLLGLALLLGAAGWLQLRRAQPQA